MGKFSQDQTKVKAVICFNERGLIMNLPTIIQYWGLVQANDPNTISNQYYQGNLGSNVSSVWTM